MSEHIVVGVLADTHVPDRVKSLHPRIIPLLRAAGVSHILHAGDISTAAVLDELRQVAPVTAVRGNRDLLTGARLPEVAFCQFGAVQVALMHGHGGWRQYWIDKPKYMIAGYDFARIVNRLTLDSGAARVVVFGHTHQVENRMFGDKLFFNPGSASFGPVKPAAGAPRWPGIGLLHIGPGGQVRAEMLYLDGYRLEQRSWVEVI